MDAAHARESDTTDAASLPRLVGDAFALAEAAGAGASAGVGEGPEVGGGAVWRLEPASRGLDANVIVLPAGDEIKRHDGPALDVLLLVLDGTGMLETDGGVLALSPGELVWLPPRSRRRIVAGGDGLRYFSVHRRKPGLGITQRPD